MDSLAMSTALLGGILIGVAAGVPLLWSGRIAGISGIVGGLLTAAASDRAWRILFVGGLLVGGMFFWMASPGRLPIDLSVSGFGGWGAIALGGLLVGFGTRLGNGCTSGHGVCGVSRGSPRSIAATATFMLTGIITVFVVKHLLGV